MSRFTSFFTSLREKLPAVSLGGRIRFAVLGLLVLAAVWIFSMAATHRIDDNVDFAVAAGSVPENASNTVAIMAALINREASQNDWVPNTPFFLPSHYLDNMPNYQRGIVSALSRVTVLLVDQIGRARGSSESDKDLDKALGLLKYPSNVWYFDPLPTKPSDMQYRLARDALQAYNARLAQGRAVFDPRSDNLVATLDAIAADIGSQSAVIEGYLREPHMLFLNDYSDDIFYATKGRMYAYYLVLREMKKDYAAVIRDRNLENVWNNMLMSFRETVELDPWIIVSAPPDDQFRPSHLAGQGFYLLRARTNLREITGVLSR
jgi:hypothetical protein